MKTYEFGNEKANIVLIQPVDDHDLEGIEKEFAAISSSCGMSVRLIAVRINNWNNDLSPWEAPAVFGKENFGSSAAKTLSELVTLCKDKGKRYFIGGYSLAGLFALWAAYQTDIFEGVAAASPSMWFPGFYDYMKKNEIKTDTVYLSLGDREEKARNPVMATVGARIREAEELLKEKGVDCVLEWNEGNHFKDADIRTAKAFAWVLNTKN
ncbi:alpha/beta hydrolase-fold protein [Butyrivibrio sp. XBB1001]|uniref:alpha/beta hydrolase-fold protein n=1 Tax=Butyrivibrio sp. XBB1001 TaxID=1280682 RepID=UPI00040D5E33|nr:alpha/beta hydrolase-fold protein [Butyrivibrio sp. XBB1001]